MSKKISLTLIGNNPKPAKIHDLVKAPANTPWAKEKQQSWDANKPATVYVTPETLPDGTPCSAVTVSYAPKAAIGGGQVVVHFVDISTILEMM
ncbi:MAG: hypothetical protein ACPF9X_00705 [Candidatus Poseidoniaceae archaeon]